VAQSTHPSPTRFGRIRPPDPAWLARAAAEPILEPELRIVDPHHHLWQRPDHRYFLDDLLADLRTGPHLLKQPDFRARLARLTALGLSLDAWAFHPQLADAVDLARGFPAANIIVGHCGGPLGYGPYTNRRDEVFAAWKAGITELARCPNVTMKLGGMMMRLAALDYGARAAPASSQELADAWRPYIELCIERFGATRCMFESNYPVEKMGIGYAALWNAFKRIAASASAAEKLALFSGTARRAYRLD
jgi:predicted TIM-barrel fold metal-dependent hydrolase